MNSASTLVAIGSLAALSACSTSGSSGEGQAAPTQWKEVTRIINGNSVTYQVPVNQKVPNDVNMRAFEPDATTPKVAPSATGAASPQAAPRAPQPAPPTHLNVAPEALPWAQPSRGAAAGAAEVAQAGSVAGAESSVAPGPGISQEAETALGQAEIAVRDAQSRFETARAALHRAREAARAGDSASAIKFAKTAASLSRPDR